MLRPILIPVLASVRVCLHGLLSNSGRIAAAVTQQTAHANSRKRARMHGSQVSRTVTVRGAADKVEQWCKLRAQLLLAMAAPCAAALRASQVSAQPPVQHLFTLMHMLSHHRARRVLAGCYNDGKELLKSRALRATSRSEPA